MKNRLLSLDAFRGLTIAFMILVNTPGSWAHVYPPLTHAPWHGCTLTDLVFPFFLFIAGTAMCFSFQKYGDWSVGAARKQILSRAVTIFAFGLLLNAFPFIRQNWDWSSFRILGVLQRIGISYAIAGMLVLKADISRIIKYILIILTGYWLLLLAWGFYSHSDPFGLETNLVRRIDMIILGKSHLWMGTGIRFDPEGLLSSLPAAATVLLGFLTGIMLNTSKNGRDTVQRMAVFGALLIILGFIWGLVFPINKQLWTSSYVLFTGGIAVLFLSFLYWIIDLKNWRKWALPLAIFGTNSIFIFVGSGMWVKTILRVKFDFEGRIISGYSYLYKTIFQPLAGDLNGSLLFALFHVFMWWLVLAWLYRKKIFIKI
ncbi:MAG: DUF5009 domain-containing protein [Candidatus Neomarinimicrobiota bacterium]